MAPPYAGHRGRVRAGQFWGRTARSTAAKLGARVFADPAALARLEAIVHPAVGQAIRDRVAASTAPLVVIEAIKLLEAGLGRSLCDQVWVTLCTRRQQLARLQASRGMSADEVRRRLANQMPPAQMTAQAHRVIDTDGTTAETAQTVLAAWVELGLPLPAPVIRRAALADCEGTAAVLNSVVREGGRTITGRTFTPAQERAFFRSLPQRAFLNIVLLGRVVAGFQVVEPYATYTHTMDHVASLGTHILAAVRGRGLGQALSAATWAEAARSGIQQARDHRARGQPAGAGLLHRAGLSAVRPPDPAGVCGRQVRGRVVVRVVFGMTKMTKDERRTTEDAIFRPLGGNMTQLRKLWHDHPNLVSWFVLAVGMVVIVVIAARNVGFTPGQWAALIAATIGLAGLCVWIISWEDGDEEAQPAAPKQRIAASSFQQPVTSDE